MQSMRVLGLFLYYFITTLCRYWFRFYGGYFFVFIFRLGRLGLMCQVNTVHAQTQVGTDSQNSSSTTTNNKNNNKSSSERNAQQFHVNAGHLGKDINNNHRQNEGYNWIKNVHFHFVFSRFHIVDRIASHHKIPLAFSLVKPVKPPVRLSPLAIYVCDRL